MSIFEGLAGEWRGIDDDLSDWFHRHARHAGGAPDRANLHKLVHREPGRTCLRTFGAIDAGFYIASNLDRAQQGNKSRQRAVRAQVTAPEVLHQHGN